VLTNVPAAKSAVALVVESSPKRTTRAVMARIARLTRRVKKRQKGERDREAARAPQ
jgi:hypothetical protein